MSELKPCWFTGEPSTYSTDFASDTVTVRSEACGSLYRLTNDLIFQLSDDAGKTPKKPTQGTVNCARKSLEVIRENRRAIPFWTSRENVASLNAYLANSRQEHGKPPKIVLGLEDYLEEIVDHSEKPIVLLEAFAEQLSRTGAFAEFNCSPRDQAWARIVGNDELWEILNSLSSEKLLSISMPSNIHGPSELLERIHRLKLKMTVDGWREVKKRNLGALSNKVFIASQFEWPEVDHERVQAIEAIKAACRRAGYDANLVSQNHTSNITDRIIAEIKSSRFVVAVTSREFCYHLLC